MAPIRRSGSTSGPNTAPVPWTATNSAVTSTTSTARSTCTTRSLCTRGSTHRDCWLPIRSHIKWLTFIRRWKRSWARKSSWNACPKSLTRFCSISTYVWTGFPSNPSIVFAKTTSNVGTLQCSYRWPSDGGGQSDWLWLWWISREMFAQRGDLTVNNRNKLSSQTNNQN